MKSVKKKLKSNKGASITFALLIFLVCAMVSSVVLAAGTAASGRMSQIAETDQRYYSVNSAAGLLSDLIDGKTVVVKREKTSTVVTTYDKVTTTNATTGEKSTTTTQVGDPVTTPGTDTTTITLETQTINIADRKKNLLTDAAVCVADTSIADAKITAPLTKTLSLSAGTTSPLSGLDVSVSEVIDPDGTINFVISNTGTNQKYKLTETFSADVNKTTGIKTDPPTRAIVSSSGNTVRYTETVNTKETTTTTITWNLDSIKY